MAECYLAEYRDVPQTMNGVVPVPVEPSLATQKFTFTGTSAQSAVLQPETRYVIMYLDAAGHYAVGPNPTATNTGANASFPVGGNVEKHIGVKPRKNYRIAVITA